MGSILWEAAKRTAELLLVLFVVPLIILGFTLALCYALEHLTAAIMLLACLVGILGIFSCFVLDEVGKRRKRSL